MKLYTRTTLLTKIFCTLCIVFLCVSISWSQNSDSTRLTLRPKTKKGIKVPEIKANIPIYKPSYLISSSNNTTLSNVAPKTSSSSLKDKLLTIVKIYPNPVEDQLNIILSLNKDTPVNIKVMDLLGNEVVTLANERLLAGEQTRTFNLPNRLNTGIYFLKITAGAETQVKRISVL